MIGRVWRALTTSELWFGKEQEREAYQWAGNDIDMDGKRYLAFFHGTFPGGKHTAGPFNALSISTGLTRLYACDEMSATEM